MTLNIIDKMLSVSQREFARKFMGSFGLIGAYSKLQARSNDMNMQIQIMNRYELSKHVHNISAAKYLIETQLCMQPALHKILSDCIFISILLALYLQCIFVHKAKAAAKNHKHQHKCTYDKKRKSVVALLANKF